MVAVVDSAAEFRVEIGSAAPAGMTTGFVQLYPPTCGAEFDRGGKTGETGPDDMHRARPGSHMRPCRSTSQSLNRVDGPTRMAGSRHPERSKAASVVR